MSDEEQGPLFGPEEAPVPSNIYRGRSFSRQRRRAYFDRQKRKINRDIENTSLQYTGTLHNWRSPFSPIAHQSVHLYKTLFMAKNLDGRRNIVLDITVFLVAALCVGGALWFFAR